MASMLTLSACGTNFSDNIVTSTAGNITKEEFYRALKQQTGTFVLRNMLVEKTLMIDYKINEEKVTQKYEEYKKQYGNQFEAFLQQQNLNEDTFKTSIRMQLLTEKAVERNISEKEIKSNYKPELRVSQIFAKDEKTIQTIKEELAKGSPFEELAKQYSEDTITKEKGGDLGYMGPEKMSQEFKEVVYKLKKGDTSEIIQTTNGYRIIKVTDIGVVRRFVL
ncbi:peptidylprolyl isomerase [Bacillus thuringiensis]|nr:peptidylprolyl isomerase [Bacillus thuringiensis]